MTDSPNEKKFMREKIVKQKVSKRQIAGRILRLFLCAVFFGVVAAVAFVISRPMAEKYLGKGPEPSTIPITIEKDDEPTTAAPMETMAETAPSVAEAESEAERKELEQIVREEMSDFPWTTSQIEALNQVFRDIAQEVDKSIVTVSSVKRQMDWFDNPVESTGQYAGVILAVNSSEVVILTGTAAVEDADSLWIQFGDGSTVQGTVKQQDGVSGLAVLSAAAYELPEATRKWIAAAEFGNSYTVRAGDMVIAVGSPAGLVHSVMRGTVSYVAKNVQTEDGQTRVLYADFDCDTEKGTFFLNMSGQLIGWASDRFGGEEKAGVTTVMPISEYKGSLQKLSNGIPIPYLGIKSQDVSEAMQEEGIPKGIYITESITDGPAYLAGIQNGDILVKLHGGTVESIRDFQNLLENLEVGDEVAVVIARKGIDEYKEIEYVVTIGAR